MLKEIQCYFFKYEKITFHKGLNIVLGDDDAKNSIGKSTALMVIDFVHGGTSFLKDDAGAIKALGQHHYNFLFIFSDVPYFFSRSTDVSDVVYICDDNYTRLEELPIEDYRRTLKRLYGLEALESSFRSIVSPFARIWKKGGLETDQPFISALKEPSETALSRLIDLFDQSANIAIAKKTIDEQKKRKKLIVRSMNAEIIPKINKSQYNINVQAITENNEQIGRLKQGFGGALNAYEALFDHNMQSMQQDKNDHASQIRELQSKIKRLQQEISGITPRLAANIALVAEFFPSVNAERLTQVEAFHQKIGSIVKKELKDELIALQLEESTLASMIVSLDEKIQSALKSKGMPDDLFKSIFDLKETTDKAINENKYFERKAQLEGVIKTSNKRLNEIYEEIFLKIEAKLNLKLKGFNKVVYGPARNSSELKIKSSSSYTFSSPDDTGTGKSYAGLIGFDRAMLSLTKLPFVIHDSVVYKNIEVAATKRILRILAAIKSKQIFLSFDEAKKFGSQTEQLINKLTVLRLSNDELLYAKDWREKK
jgi:predicted  nucleic acid-binding Zn-ribbon protein